jgi:hypothetical protein
LSAAAVHAVSGITKNGAGDYTITWSTPFSSGAYAYTVMAEATAGNNVGIINVTSGGKAAGSLRIAIFNNSGTPFDPPSISVAAFGDH